METVKIWSTKMFWKDWKVKFLKISKLTVDISIRCRTGVTLTAHELQRSNLNLSVFSYKYYLKIIQFSWTNWNNLTLQNKSVLYVDLIVKTIV